MEGKNALDRDLELGNQAGRMTQVQATCQDSPPRFTLKKVLVGATVLLGLVTLLTLAYRRAWGSAEEAGGDAGPSLTRGITDPQTAKDTQSEPQLVSHDLDPQTTLSQAGPRKDDLTKVKITEDQQLESSHVQRKEPTQIQQPEPGQVEGNVLTWTGEEESAQKLTMLQGPKQGLVGIASALRQNLYIVLLLVLIVVLGYIVATLVAKTEPKADGGEARSKAIQEFLDKVQKIAAESKTKTGQGTSASAGNQAVEEVLQAIRQETAAAVATLGAAEAETNAQAVTEAETSISQVADGRAGTVEAEEKKAGEAGAVEANEEKKVKETGTMEGEREKGKEETQAIAGDKGVACTEKEPALGQISGNHVASEKENPFELVGGSKGPESQDGDGPGLLWKEDLLHVQEMEVGFNFTTATEPPVSTWEDKPGTQKVVGSDLGYNPAIQSPIHGNVLLPSSHPQSPVHADEQSRQTHEHASPQDRVEGGKIERERSILDQRPHGRMSLMEAMLAAFCFSFGMGFVFALVFLVAVPRLKAMGIVPETWFDWI